MSFILESLSYDGYIQDSESGPDVGQITKQLKEVNDYFQRFFSFGLVSIDLPVQWRKYYTFNFLHPS